MLTQMVAVNQKAVLMSPVFFIRIFDIKMESIKASFAVFEEKIYLFDASSNKVKIILDCYLNKPRHFVEGTLYSLEHTKKTILWTN